jgi:hypothetical protein
MTDSFYFFPVALFLPALARTTHLLAGAHLPAGAARTSLPARPPHL